MLGIKAFLLLFAPLIVALGFITAVVLDWRSGKRPIGGAIFVALWSLVVFNYVGHHLLERQFLKHVGSDEIRQICIEETCFSSVDQISEIVEALNSIEWFVINHGGWDQEYPMRIELRSGKVKHYLVSYYQRRHGAVIQFFPPAEKGQFFRPHYGAAFSASLPDVLAALGHGLRSARRLDF